MTSDRHDEPGGRTTQRFHDAADKIMEAVLTARPEWATELGDHRFDERLCDLGADGIAAYGRVLTDGIAALDEIDETAIGPQDRVDLEILRNHLASELWTHSELAPHTWDPLLHLPVDGVYGLLARPTPDPAGRLRSLCARLRAVPAMLETGRATLGRMPRVHVETAIQRAHGVAALLGADVDALVEQAGSADPRAELDAAREQAAGALADHARWLEARLEDSDADPRLGAPAFAAKLWYTLDTQTDPDALLTRAESDLMAIEEEISELAARIAGTPAHPGQVREVLDRLADDAPVTDQTILGLCQRYLDDATTRVRELDLVTVPEMTPRIIEMPESRRGTAVAYCDPPGPLEPDGPDGPPPTLFAVSPTPADWTAERVASFYREYNGYLLRDMAIHEAMPGHALQLAHARGHASPTTVRAALWSGPFVEGWAVYAEELIAGVGLRADEDAHARDALDAMRLKMRLRSTINAILDIRVHAHGMTEAEAMSLMIERGHQEEGEAAGKWRRALLTSAQLSTYYVGHKEVSRIVADLRTHRPQAGEREIHDAVLAHGSPAPRHLRTLLALE